MPARKGADQVIAMESTLRGDVFMRIWNKDGSSAEACGNATRCVAWSAIRSTKVMKPGISLITIPVSPNKGSTPPICAVQNPVHATKNVVNAILIRPCLH